MKMRTVGIRRIAYHEAGHAVMAWRKGLIHSVSILNDGDMDGVVRHSMNYYRYDDERIRICYAGPIAEAKIAKIGLGRVLLTTGSDDFKQILEIVQEFENEGIKLDFKDIIKWTKIHVYSRWSAVIALATALITRKEITGEDVNRIIEKAIEID